ncbi:TetR/AcrR family transcriptional regulator [Bernardetia sp. ABR2-2B]|uniref:TetR/AcrR family transcriptional regulator n=1 Tax=Bernardetia sp. ABR2-2B TaxID=3127472 RepID=UPI0030CDCE34
MNKSWLPWIEIGYTTFAYQGMEELKIERLAKKVGKNKSSFYHHFADMEIFISQLLKYHIEQSKILAIKEGNCISKEELIDILVEHKTDLLFNRQLRIHRQKKEFEDCFVKTNEITLPNFLNLWSEILGLTGNTDLSKMMLNLSLENFYLQITEKTLNHTWLNNYFKELQRLTKEFKRTSQINLPILNGSV